MPPCSWFAPLARIIRGHTAGHCFSTASAAEASGHLASASK